MEETPDVTRRRESLISLCRSLPAAEVEAAGAQHLAFKVRKRIFGYYLYDHHGDGRIALCCKAPPGEQARLVEANPARYFVPSYVGSKGWVGLRLDLAKIDWQAVRDLLVAAFFMTAPKALRSRLEGDGSRPSRRPARRRPP